MTAGPIRFKLTLAKTMRSRVRLFTITVALSANVGACAAIWGFQDAIDRHDPDGGLDVDSTVNAGDSRVETSTARDNDAADAPRDNDTANAPRDNDVADAAAITPSEGEAAMPTGTVDAAGDLDSPVGIDVGFDVVSQCDAVCAPTPPIGWEGPFEISAPAVTYFRLAMNCPQGACGTSTLDNCVATSAAGSQCPQTPHGFQVGSSAAVGGGCTPGGSTVLPPVGWGANARLCAPAVASTNGCAPGSLCLPTLDPQFQNTSCIVARADAGACPSAYPVAHPRSEFGAALYYADASDERSCTACTCGPPGGVTCADASVLTYSNSDTCMPRTDGVSLPAPSGCILNTGVLGMEFAGATPSGGKCVPDGGQPQGGIVPTAPYTICCTQ